SPEVIEQYQAEERTAMAHRAFASRRQLLELLNIMAKDEISDNYKVKMLKEELNVHFNTHYFSRCQTMGAIVKRQLKIVLKEYLQQVKPS
ncbi:MAG: hypothetical protein KA409_07955, partial [Ferruginibacter sp.]|nr:hypothetical protein [Ferruginibacter sp.]